MVIDFHAHYARQPDFLPGLIEALPEVGIDRICLCSAGEEFGHVGNAEVRTAFALLRLLDYGGSWRDLALVKVVD